MYTRKPLTAKRKAQLKTREAVAALLTAQGWKKDNYGNFKKEQAGDQYRYKFEDNVLRYETKIGDYWSRVKSGYWKDLEIVDEKIVGWK